jgi:hypothetical protein
MVLDKTRKKRKMVKDIVIIPTFSRPEMLWLCLERLRACPETKHMDIRVYVDNHDAVRTNPPSAEIGRVIEMHSDLPITLNWRKPHPFGGNTFNVLEAYREAYEESAEYVFLVEDDVMVNPDFFAWHYEAQETGDWASSIASRCLKGGAVQEQYIVNRSFASIGCCFKRERLELIAPHACAAYYRDMVGYMRLAFPQDGRADQYTEQDGLIERIISKNGYSIWPVEPRCTHVGWYGYHRWNSTRPAGSLDERYHHVRRVISDPELLKAASNNVVDVETVKL